MVRTSFCVYVLALLLARFAPAAAVAPATAAAPAVKAIGFPVGETLSYKLYWGKIPVGTARIWSEWIEEGGRRLIALRMTAQTGPIVHALYPVDDAIESIVDPATLLPIRYSQRLREGRKHRQRDVDVVFSYDKRKAFWHNVSKDVSSDLDIGPDTRDILSFIYFMRAQAFDAGRRETFRVIVDEKIYALTLVGLEYQEISTPAVGDIKTLKLEPIASFGEIFTRKGRVWCWFSTDERRLCVRMQGEVPVASLHAVLVSVSDSGEPARPGSG